MIERTAQIEHEADTRTLQAQDTRPAVIVADHIYKRYRKQSQQVSLRHEAQKLLARALRRNTGPVDEPFWALHDVTFTIRAGESVALIGRNGAGKTTLFRVLCGITHASQGRAMINGRFATLIALGAGFNMERTGRENILLNAAIQGVPIQQVKSLMPEIIAFSELGEFIDSPVKRYSSGMVTRLGFSIAAHIFPDIIFVDEVLAVGDAAFQQKCMDRIMTMKAEGRTLMFVSHSADTVRDLCERAIWLHHGRLLMDGPAAYVLSCYEDLTRVEHHWQQVAQPAQQGQPAQAPMLVAIPNPVPVYLQSGAVIAWNTGNGEVGQVYVSCDGGPEILFGQAGSEVLAAPWLAPDATYAFTLYAGTTHTCALAEVVVSRIPSTGEHAEGVLTHEEKEEE